MTKESRRKLQLQHDLEAVVYMHQSWLSLSDWREACRNVGEGFLPEDGEEQLSQSELKTFANELLRGIREARAELRAKTKEG